MNEYKERYKYKRSNGLIPSPYDKRDYKFKDIVPLGAFMIPDNYESKEFPYVYDQGQTQMCVACSYSAVRYLQESEWSQSGITEPFSPTLHYGNRPDDEMFEGMYLRTCCKNGRQGSILLRELNEFCTTKRAVSLVRSKSEEYFKKAEPYKISSFYTCNSRREIQQAIISTKAVITGIPIYDSFFTPNSEGIIEFNPSKDIRSYGGHAITLTGWKTVNNILYWRVLNSWGIEWGQNGYCWLPESYPWIEQVYAIVDTYIENTFQEYMKQFYS